MTSPRSTKGRQALLFIAKLLVSGALILFVVSRISLSEVREAMMAPHWGWLLSALVVYGLSAVAGAQQWAWILHAGGIKAPVREISRLYFIGLFFNNFLPANIGGDAYKIIDLGRHEKKSMLVLCATVLDRIIGLSALTALAVVAMVACTIFDIPLPGTALLLIPVLIALFVILAVLLSRRLGSQLPRMFNKLGMTKLAGQVEQLTTEIGCYREQVRFLNLVFLFSVGVQLLRMATHVLVALGLGFALGSTQMVQLLVLVPMLAVSLTLPVTINGIGLRESLSAELLIFAGIGGSQAVAMEVAAYLVQVVFSLQGGLLLWWGRGNRSDR
ncbi:MAG: hypothetical protein ACI8S7_000139 [Candidatus Krumholzibacteriia bacterium]|jgi:uncharacterized protein (TIRG00374 family)